MRTAFSLHPAADPADPAGGKPEETPTSPKIVAKTAIKTPREISLEKELSKTQDDVASLVAWQKEINGFLGDTFPGGKPAPMKVKQLAAPATPSPSPETPALRRHDVDTYIWG